MNNLMVADPSYPRRSHPTGRNSAGTSGSPAVVFLTATTLAATLLAGLCILLPVGLPSDREVTEATRTVMIFALPQSTGAGVSVAVGTALILANMQRAIVAWATALAGTVIILLGHTVLAQGTLGTSLTSLNYLDAIAGGLLLAGVTIGMRPGKPQLVGWVVGILAVIWVGGSPPGTRVVNPSHAARVVNWYTGESPPRVLIVITLVLVLVSAYYDRLRTELPLLSYELPVAPVLSGAVVVVEAMTVPDWVTRHPNSGVVLVTAVVGEIVLALIAALLLPGRDGYLLLIATALTAAGQARQAPHVSSWMAALLAAVVACGVWPALRRPTPGRAILGIVAMAAVGLLTYRATAEQHWQAIAMALVMALAGGYALASCRITYRPVRVIAVAVIYTPGVTRGLRDARRPIVDPGAVYPDRWPITATPPPSSYAPALAALVIAIGCGLCMLVLRHLRPEQLPKPRAVAAPPDGPDADPDITAADVPGAPDVDASDDL